MTGSALLRMLAWSVALVLLALPVVGVLSGKFASERWPLRKLDLTAPVRQVPAQRIQEVVDAHTREGFFALSLPELRSALAELPWVSHVEVRKRWPDTVVVRIDEHQPYAVWQDRALVSHEGVLFEVPQVPEMAELPRLFGPDERIVEVVNFHARSVRTFERSALHPRITQLSPRGSWTVQLDNGTTVLLGRDRADERLARFAATAPTLLQGHPQQLLSRADLRYPNGYALTWTDVPPAEVQATASNAASPTAATARPAPAKDRPT